MEEYFYEDEKPVVPVPTKVDYLPMLKKVEVTSIEGLLLKYSFWGAKLIDGDTILIVDPIEANCFVYFKHDANSLGLTVRVGY